MIVGCIHHSTRHGSGHFERIWKGQAGSQYWRDKEIFSTVGGKAKAQKVRGEVNSARTLYGDSRILPHRKQNRSDLGGMPSASQSTPALGLSLAKYTIQQDRDTQ